MRRIGFAKTCNTSIVKFLFLIIYSCSGRMILRFDSLLSFCDLVRDTLRSSAGKESSSLIIDLSLSLNIMSGGIITTTYLHYFLECCFYIWLWVSLSTHNDQVLMIGISIPRLPLLQIRLHLYRRVCMNFTSVDYTKRSIVSTYKMVVLVSWYKSLIDWIR